MAILAMDCGTPQFWWVLSPIKQAHTDLQFASREDRCATADSIRIPIEIATYREQKHGCLGYFQAVDNDAPYLVPPFSHTPNAGCVTRSAGIIPSPGTPGEGRVGVFFDKLTWFSGFPPPQPSPGVPGEGEIGCAGTVTHPQSRSLEKYH